MTAFPDLGFKLSRAEAAADGYGWSVHIHADAPAFRGHFPNRPILPGVAQLALLEHALGLTQGRLAPLGEVHGVRFRRIVGPGETLLLDLRASDGAAPGTYRFDLHADGLSVANGTLRTLAELAAPLDEISLAAELPAREPFAAETRVPHEQPARLVERLIAWGDDAARAEAQIPTDSPFAWEGRAPTLLAIEIAAQAAALFEAASRGSDGRNDSDKPREGYLVLVRRARFGTTSLPTATQLEATIRLAGSAPPLALYEFNVSLGGKTVAHGTLGTFLAGSAGAA